MTAPGTHGPAYLRVGEGPCPWCERPLYHHEQAVAGSYKAETRKFHAECHAVWVRGGKKNWRYWLGVDLDRQVSFVCGGSDLRSVRQRVFEVCGVGT